jgi:hypothetical protein
MQFTRNNQSTFTIGVTNCREALEKKLVFAMWPLGRSAGAGRPKSGGSGEGDGRERVWGGGGAHLGSI